MDITENTPQAICAPKNSFVLVQQNIRVIINKTEELHEFISIKKLYLMYYVSLSVEEVHFVGILILILIYSCSYDLQWAL